MGFEIIVILLLIIANGIFAMTEIAIVSAKKVRLENLAGKGSAGAQRALQLANEPTQLLSTIQVGISVISTFTGAFGGATIAEILAVNFSTIPALAPYSGAIALAIVVTVITYLSLILGELVPKRIALNNPEGIAVKVAAPINVFAKIVAPLVHLLSGSTELVLKIMGIKEKEEEPVTEEEISLMMARGTQTGAFEQVEQDIVENVFNLSDLRVKSLFTPRTQVDWLNLEASDEENLEIIANSRHSRFPVGRGSLDEIAGIVYAKDLLSRKINCHSLELESLLKEALFVPKSMRAFTLLEMFKRKGTEIALVIDEYGSLQGLVTIDDVMEEIVGDIPQPGEDENEEIIRRDQNSWLLDGLLSLEEFKELFGIAELPGEESGLFQTLAGFIMSYLGYIPKEAERFEIEGLRFEIVDMDRVRIDKVLVTKI